MSRSLRSYTDIGERKQAIKRRLKQKTGGLGYLSAVEAARVYSIQEEAERKLAEETNHEDQTILLPSA